MIRRGHDSAAFAQSPASSNRRAYSSASARRAASVWADSIRNRGSGSAPGWALGGSAITTWALVPPNPKELTPAKRRSPCSRQRRRLPGDDQIEARKVDVRVRVFKMKRARRLVVLERKHRLQKAGKSRNGFGVSDVGLDGPDRQRTRAGVPEHLAERGRFDRIARSGSRSVSLDIGDRIRRDAGPVVDGAQKLDLITARRAGKCRSYARPN